MIARGKRRLEALGYFSSVNISTQPGSSPDRVVLVVDVQDQATGSLGIGAVALPAVMAFFSAHLVEEKNFLRSWSVHQVSAGDGQERVGRLAGRTSLSPTSWAIGWRLVLTSTTVDVERR